MIERILKGGRRQSLRKVFLSFKGFVALWYDHDTEDHFCEDLEAHVRIDEHGRRITEVKLLPGASYYDF